MKVLLSTGEIGIIEGSFGQSGKVKIRLMGNIFLNFEPSGKNLTLV